MLAGTGDSAKILREQNGLRQYQWRTSNINQICLVGTWTMLYLTPSATMYDVAAGQ
ncbi:hypothetical protein QDX91_004070 [Salmonella enterica]|nr:hypothetical protein [Salmonella enterica subsp. enterica]EEE4266587.1 hypothetical protein [Salmonella enterica subsp. enterica serovar Sandiego]EJW2128704.1 hypothetical protein [Salmonella enterica]EKT1704596.1 hypothetical protein [Salmonella enterica]ELC6906981.1 hypothetical protein [Salmonella enterica]